ncbi:rRNA-processing protein [Saccharomycopsis crataegensis]|uniref:rRNA-processing protein n=1 Tax=Saccharomycopsis crataegensis TaxID=43959 RepID=A0AAV5QLN4_9ASCO|nr:rRNA-processing protein [Saccharomycopsis crataegensis]
MMSHPQVVPWKSTDEIEQLKEWFFNGSDDEKLKAIAKVKAYLVRGKLLHSIESTCLLTSAKLNDKAGADTLYVRMTYSFALVKFVNGLLDPHQKSTHAIPLHSIARKFNLPSSFVEIRHISTHESLAGLKVLRNLVADALQWLYDNFWNENDFSSTQSKKDFEVKSNPSKLSERDQTKFYSQVKDNLRVYRRFHRNGIRLVNENEMNDDPEIINYWENLHAMRDFLINKEGYNREEIFKILLNVMCFKNVLIITKKDIKFGQLRALYTPLLTYLNSVCEMFKYEQSFSDILFEFLVAKQEQYYSEKDGTEFDFRNDAEIKLSTKWLEHLLTPKYTKSLLNINNVLNIIENHGKNKQTPAILDTIQSKVVKTPAQTEKLDQLIAQSSNYLPIEVSREPSTDPSTKSRKRSTDKIDVNDEIANFKKRLKNIKTNATSESKSSSISEDFYFWQPVEFYEPTPFGVPL